MYASDAVKPFARATATTLSLMVLAIAACAQGDDSARDTTAATGSVSEASREQTSVADDAGEDVKTYRLTMDKVNRFYDAFREGTIAAGNRMESDTLSDFESLDQIVKEIEREPKVARAVRNAGMSPREYVVATFAMMHAGMAHQLLKMQPKTNVDSLARELEIPVANIHFMRDHWTEIEAKGEAAKAAIRAAGVSID